MNTDELREAFGGKSIGSLVSLPNKAEFAQIPIVETIRLKPDDVIVLYANGPMANPHRESLVASMRELFRNNKAIVVCDGMRIGIMSPAEVADNPDIVDGK